MPDLLVKIKMFGAFRIYAQGPFLELTIPCGTTIYGLKKLLAKTMAQNHQDFDDQLIQDSVIASQDAILPGNTVLGNNAELAILPPVCGG
jgi:molybdopterin converting factor small subunit